MPNAPTNRTLRLPPSATMGPGNSEYQQVRLGGCIVMGWYEAVSAGVLEQWREAIAAQAEDNGGKVGLVVCIRETSVPPEGALRTLAGKITFGSNVRAAVLVFEGTGFRAAIVRSVLAMMFSLNGGGTPYKIMNDATEASRWLARECSAEPWCPSSHDLRTVMQALLNTT